MKQTAVEWYAEQSMLLELKRAKGNISITQMLNELSNILEKAKLIEIDQMRAVHLITWMNRDFDFEQYIKEQ
jgi:hypothetical protein